MGLQLIMKNTNTHMSYIAESITQYKDLVSDEKYILALLIAISLLLSVVTPSFITTSWFVIGMTAALSILTALVLLNMALSVFYPLGNGQQRFSPEWAAMVFGNTTYLILWVGVLPYLMWETTLIGALTETRTALTGTLDIITQGILSLGYVLGTFFLFTGIIAFFIVKTSVSNMVYYQMLTALSHKPEYDHEEIADMYDVLVDTGPTNQEIGAVWNDVTPDSEDWTWDIDPRRIQYTVENTPTEVPLLPVSTESHRIWRIAGAVILLVSIILTILTGDGLEAYQLAIFLGGTFAFLFALKFYR